jgi:intracellular sulfur oxidation DsrE/DsrF family protein
VKQEQYSANEMLHAFADGQLDAAQSRDVLALLETDLGLQKELCEIQRLKHLVQSAYPLPSASNVAVARYRPQVWQRAAVYVLAFSLTFLAGAGSQYLPRWWEPEGVALAGASAAHDNRFIVFLDSHEPVKLEKALSKAENLAAQVADKDGSVYVVTSADGIDLLRLGTSEHEGRILHMSHAYPHLRFVACSNTLYSFKQRGELVALVDEAEVVPSAVEFVVQHMRDGWRYISI